MEVDSATMASLDAPLNVRHTTEPACSDVLDLVGLAVGGIDGANEHIVGDIVKMPAVLQLGTRHGDVVSCGLAFCLNQNWAVQSIISIPRGERGENLKTVGRWRDLDVHGRVVLGRSLICILARVVSILRETIASRRSQQELIEC